MWQIKEFDYNDNDRIIDFLNLNKDKISNISITYKSIGMRYVVLYYVKNINDIIE